ncbi:hypothetical protein CPT_Moonbeam134 [Bacillus phage Moonbeam]|uniref:Uncharacterized protein n=1 Tax=Bacillus phage Moonbeam TaxID=1540091 RepID=A0A0A0RNF7_9CAUD|nr:hypothetical protein CPT_Moonbeam134 [Bacillus phage Moonbeam]AIW03532.1 hypothetical protein CPT_Moonbeam134 [Bacillus phage Moonbeam]
MEQLKQFIGKIGTTKDTSFGELATLLDEAGIVVQDREFFQGESKNKWFDLVSTAYRVEGKYYELWYQVHTPYTPPGVLCSYGFREIDPID